MDIDVMAMKIRQLEAKVEAMAGMHAAPAPAPVAEVAAPAPVAAPVAEVAAAEEAPAEDTPAT
jgi:hypothetical protein